MQAGWAKCEPEKGVYHFEWLDEIINHIIAQGVEPWLQTSYGNPIYEGGGGIHLSAGFPTSEVALAAWDDWVSAMAERYQGKVKIWEIWNEPDNGRKKLGGRLRQALHPNGRNYSRHHSRRYVLRTVAGRFRKHQLRGHLFGLFTTAKQTASGG